MQIRIFMFITCFILIVAGFPVKAYYSEGSTIVENDKVSVIDETTVISSEYSFISQFNSDKTEVLPFGMDYTITKSNRDGSGIDYYSFNPLGDDSKKGEFGIVYTNIGYYEGKEIDLKITILDWDYYLNNNSGKISFGSTFIGMNTQGYDYVEQIWEFFESETDEKIQVKGYMTINDIDGAQGVTFHRDTVSVIDEVLINEAALDFLHYLEHDNGDISFYDVTNLNIATTDPRGIFTVLLDSTDSIRFSWDKDHAGVNFNKNYVYDTHWAGGQFFSFIAKKPARTEITVPEKEIEFDGERSRDWLNVRKNEPYYFNLYHSVHDEWEEFYYDKYIITDEVAKGLKVLDVDIKNHLDESVEDWFINESEGNFIKFSAKEDTLNNPDFYNSRYRFRVKVIVDDQMDFSITNSSQSIEINNVFMVEAASFSKISNNVQAILPVRQIDVYHKVEKDGEILEHLQFNLFDGEEYSFTAREDYYYKEDYVYKPTNSHEKNGVVDGEDIVLKFYYRLPLIDLGLERIQIYTAPYNDGLPLLLDINTKYPNGDSPELQIKEVTINLYDESNTIIKQESFKLSEIPSQLKWTIPSIFLSVDSKQNYRVEIAGLEEDIILSEQHIIDTDGYTASERNLIIQQFDNANQLEYEGVIMSERIFGQEITLYHEQFKMNFSKLDKIKAGYGYSVNQNLSYVTDLEELMVDGPIDLRVIIDENIVDGDYEAERGLVEIDLLSEVTLNAKKLEQHSFLPEVFVEEMTGDVFRTFDNHKGNILHSGGNKLYVPIWIDELKEYELHVSNLDSIGINKFNVNIYDNLDVYAYMYGHIGSDTIDQDEILIEPVNLHNPFRQGLPEGWSEEDINWITGGN